MVDGRQFLEPQVRLQEDRHPGKIDTVAMAMRLTLGLHYSHSTP